MLLLLEMILIFLTSPLRLSELVVILFVTEAKPHLSMKTNKFCK